MRITTSNELCYLELGIPPLKALDKQRQRKFFNNTWRERMEMVDDPWVHVLRLVLGSNTTTARYVSDLISVEKDDIEEALQKIRESVLESESSRKVTYKVLNPNFEVHEVYTKKMFVNDKLRVSFSRM